MDRGASQQVTQTRGVSLGFKCLAVFSLIMALSAVMIALVVARLHRETTLLERGERVTRHAEALAQRISTDVGRKITHLVVRANDLCHVGPTEALTSPQRALELLQNSMPGYAWIGCASREGKLLAATGGLLVGETIASLPWFQSGLRGTTVSDRSGAGANSGAPQQRAAEPLRFIDLAHPVINHRGETIGIIVAHLGVRWFEGLIHPTPSEHRYSEQAFQSVISQDTVRLMGAGIGHEAIQKVREDGRPSGWLHHINRYSSNWLIGFSRHKPIEGVTGELNWTTVVQIPADSIDSTIAAPRATIFAAIAAIALIAGLTFVWLIQAVNRPITELIRQINLAQRGHQEIPPLAGLPKEFTQVRLAVNDLTRSIRSQSTQLAITLNELQLSFRGLTDSFPGVLFSARLDADWNWTFTYLSSSAEHYLGTRASLHSSQFAALNSRIVPETREALASSIREQVQAGDAIDVLINIAGGDGRVRQMQAKAKKRLVNSYNSIWDGVMLDVSDLIEARRQAAEANRSKSDFLASVSHEIRTPLHGILGLAQLLSEEVQVPAQKADLRRLKDTAEMLATLLNDVLDHSRIEAGELALESHPFGLSEMLDSCSALFRFDTQRRGLRFDVNPEFPPDLWLLGDPTRIRQVIINLLSNAVKFTREGSVTLRVVAHPRSDGRITLSVSVTDTGPGISTEQQSRLFTRFVQGDRSVYRQFGGTGLGLAIVKRLLDTMGGSINVVSTPGQGSSFRVVITLPIAPKPNTQSPQAPPLSGEPLDILIVDDVALNRDLLHRLLAADGHRITEAADGAAALTATSQRRFDLVMLDIEMPGMNGLDVCRKIRAGQGPNRATRIVALTGYAFESDVAQAMAAGMNAHLAKPIMVGALRAQIDTLRAGGSP